MAKINAANVRIETEGVGAATTKFRMLENVCMEMTNDSMLGIIQGGTIYKDFEADAKMREAWAKAQAEKSEEVVNTNKAPPKGGKAPVAPVEDAEPDVLLEDTFENEILQPSKYSDDK